MEDPQQDQSIINEIQKDNNDMPGTSHSDIDKKKDEDSEHPQNRPLTAWFLGPRAENAQLWQELLQYIFQDYIHWRRNYFPNDPVVVNRVRRRSAAHEAWTDHLTAELDSILNELKGHFPFHSPRYIAHMLSEQTLPAVLGYFAGMLFNPNNVTDEAAPVTVRLELEVGRLIAEMLGYDPKRCWAHICSGGTIAHLEALWVARMVQFIPFIVRDYCIENKHDFKIKLADNKEELVTEASERHLIALKPNESIFMLRKLASFLQRERKREAKETLKELNDFFKNNRFNPTKSGIHSILSLVSLKPVIFVTSTAHYSVKKAANVLGYGEQVVRLVPIDNRFRMDIKALRDMILALHDDEYIAAVIGIVGTTEEGAVDPIHEIRFLRDEMSKERNRSFWLHVDAAWGGYIRTLFCGLKLKRVEAHRDLDSICDDYIHALDISERFLIESNFPSKWARNVNIRWGEKDVYKAFLALPDADSIIVDPHKLGFIPYPAGAIAFRNGLVTELITQKAQYISDESGGLKGIDEPPKIEGVGPYIIEGSKPGAAVLACWLAHKTIPLEARGHGKIVRTTLLNTRKAMKYMVYHRFLFKQIHREVFGTDTARHPFTFIPLSEPDTNILCYVARPMVWQEGKLCQVDIGLERLNAINRRIWESLSIPSGMRRERLSSSQPYFVSRTTFEPQQYRPSSMIKILSRIGISKTEYRHHELFSLRSSIMNPWYYPAEKAGMNYLYEFIVYLHKVTSQAIEELHNEKIL